VDSIPGLIAVLSASGEVERVSQPLLDYLGRSLEELRQWAVDDTFTRTIALGTFRLLSELSPQEIQLNTKQYEFVVSMASTDG
jgi:hypothetical protein